MDAQQIIKQLNSLKTIRSPLETHIRDCYHYAQPSRQQFLNIRLEDEYKQLYDTTLIESTQLLASSLQQGTIPANSKWFTMRTGIGDDKSTVDTGDRWLEETSDTLFKRIHASNFDSEAFDFLTDLVVAGYGIMYINMLPNKDLNFKCWPINNVYLDSHNEHQTIDCVYREYELTAEQIRNTYKDVHESINRAKATDKFKLVHAIYPNKEYKKAKVNIKSNMPFKSVIVDIKNKHVLEDDGYNTFPVVVARFNKNHNNLYATGQVTQVLEDARIVNKMNKLVLNSAELSLGGIWLAKNNGVLNVHNLKLRPRTIIPANSMDDLKRIDMNTNINISVELVSMYQNRIKRGMMSDQLTPINSSPLSATEVSARVNIIRNQLSSVFVRMQTEFLNGLLTRVFDLLIRNGLIPQPPQELVQKGGNLNFTFTNPLAQSSKLESVTNLTNWLNVVLPLINVNQDILDVIDFDKVVYTLQDSLSVTPDVVLTKEQVEEIRNAKAEQAQAQINAQQEQQVNQLVAQEQELVNKEAGLTQ